MSTQVILDTDIGSDIDDAVCLAYLLGRPDCDLLGITTVSGEPVKRAMIASAQCKCAGKKVPIYPGVEKPLLGSQHQPLAPQAAALQGWDHDTEFPRGEAVEFLRHTIRTHPGEITLLAIGPLTNIALLFASDPEIPGLLKSLVLMGGVFDPERFKKPGMAPSEWNIRCDPHAASIVYGARPAVHRSIGLDVTTQVTMEAAEVRAKFTTRLLKPVLDFAEVWFKHTGKLTFHDPLAATTIFNADICGFERGRVGVGWLNPEQYAATLWQRDPAGPHEVATTVDAEKFFGEYFRATA